MEHIPRVRRIKTSYSTCFLTYKPGSKWQYYYDYVRDHIFKPAGMTATASEPEDQVVADRSVGYMRSDAGGWQLNTDTLPYRGTSAGGGYSTSHRGVPTGASGLVRMTRMSTVGAALRGRPFRIREHCYALQATGFRSGLCCSPRP
jgi:CubicO group peptidase (beta-lactamase class C family)